MSQRNVVTTQNQFAEENLDMQLKDAGLWEEGLSVNEKHQLLNLIRDSKNSAKQEESERQKQKQDNLSTLDQKKVQDAKSSTSPTIEDCEPIITFESPSTSNKRKLINSCEKGRSEAIPQKDTKENDKENSANSMMQHTKSPTLCKGTLKQISSLFSNSSITVQYASPSGSKDTAVMVSETDEDSDENVEPLTLKDRVLNNRTNNSTSNSQNVIEKNYSNKYSLTNKKDEIINSQSPKHSLNITAIKKALLSEPVSPLCNKKSSKKATLLNNEPDSEIISEVDSLELFTTEKSAPNSVPSSQENTTPTIFNCFVPASHKDVPLKKKVDLLSEKQSQTYFKAPYETETKCVKRIYSLISDWQIALADYQNKHPSPCKWGPPISVDRQIKVGLVKKSYITKISKFNQAEPISADTGTSDLSSESDTQAFEQDDEDFEIFLKKRRRPTNRKATKRKLIEKNTKNYNLEKSSDVESEEKKSHLMNTNNKTEEKKNLEEKVISSPIPDSPIPDSQNIETDLSQEDKNEISSQNTHSEPLHDPSKILQILDQPMKAIRKSFDLTPDPISSKPESKVSLLGNQSTKSVLLESSTTNHNDTAQDITLYSSSSEEETSQKCDIEMNPIKRSSIKRKTSATPLNMPPIKKSTQNHSSAELQHQIRPSPLRMRGLLSKTLNSKPQIDNSPRTYSAKTSVKKATIIEATVSDAEDGERGETETGRGGVGTGTETGGGVGRGGGETVRTRGGTGSGVGVTACDSSTVEASKPGSSSQVDSGSSQAPPNQNQNRNIPSSCPTPVLIECPLCQDMFPSPEIEGHASECNGPSDNVVLRKRQPNVLPRNQ